MNEHLTKIPEGFVYPSITEIAQLPVAEDKFYQLTAGCWDWVFCIVEKDSLICTIASRQPHDKVNNLIVYKELMAIQFKIKKEKSGEYVLTRFDNESNKNLTFKTIEEMIAVETL